METNKEKQQQRLEEIFDTVDKIKIDLNKTTGIDVVDQFGMTLIIGEEKIRWNFNPEDCFIERQGKLMILDVTDFKVTFFPEAKSVLYRIKLDGKEQIRGYIFLQNLEA